MLFKDLKKALGANVRDYGMFIALFVIMAFFTITTKGLFISSQNISNLLNQTGYIAVLAVGMTLVIVVRHIDLSVGFLAGFLGAVGAIGLSAWHLPAFVVIPMVLALGVLAGLATAFLVAKLGIPSFVASLAGWLIYRGALLLVTRKAGTIIIDNPTFNAIGNGYIPDIFPEFMLFEGMHKLTLLLGMVAVVWFVLKSLRDRKNKQAYGFDVLPTGVFVIKLVFISLILLAIVWNLAGYNGLSWTMVIVLAVVFIYDFVTRHTVLGRHIYAVGGNPEAAELSGISVKKIVFTVFASMGMLSALSGILFSSYLASASPQAGTLFELDAIAAAYIGGVSAAGGVGKVTGSLIGAIVYMTLTSGMNLMGTDMALQYVVRGAVLALAVIFDVQTRKVRR
ncbi:MAG: sugar ABC transporter permease [Spirochaetales bacterium]|nr:sugar ABC transporter permease [Spirochaetales bacterium]MBP7262935.1 sugar ABC transporter permease [Spirochaetia bacterium]